MVGEFKDDALQQHKHVGTYNNYPNGVLYLTSGNQGMGTTGNVSDARTDKITRGKRKGVKYIIKVL